MVVDKRKKELSQSLHKIYSNIDKIQDLIKQKMTRGIETAFSTQNESKIENIFSKVKVLEKEFITKYDCKECHFENKKQITFKELQSLRYRLLDKIASLRKEYDKGHQSMNILREKQSLGE